MGLEVQTSGNLGREVYEQLAIQAPECEDRHAVWHACICRLVRFSDLPPVPSHAVHVWLKDIGVYSHLRIMRYENVTWESEHEEKN